MLWAICLVLISIWVIAANSNHPSGEFISLMMTLGTGIALIRLLQGEDDPA